MKIQAAIKEFIIQVNPKVRNCIVFSMLIGMVAACRVLTSEDADPAVETEFHTPGGTVEKTIAPAVATSTPTKTATLVPASALQPTPTMPPTAPVRRIDWNLNTAPIIPAPSGSAPGEYGVGPAVISRQGRVAVGVARTIYVQSADGSDRYEAIDHDAGPASWSPDGSMLLYCRVEGSPYGCSDIRIYQVEENYSFSLSEVIPDFPKPPYSLGSTWSFDSTKIYFTDLVADQLVTVDVVEGRMWQFINFTITNLWDFAHGYVIVENHCGSPCETISAYTYSGEEIWSLPWYTAGLFDINHDKNRLINSGRVDTQMDTLTVEEIDLTDGSMEVIWSLEDWSEDVNFTLFFPPALSDDEQYLSFSLGENMRPRNLVVIDRDGDVLAEVPDAVFPIWGRGMEMVFVLAHFEEEEYLSLIYYDVEQNQFTTLLEDMGSCVANPKHCPEMPWSPDKTLFAYTSFNEADGTTELFIWDPALGQSTLVYAEESEWRLSDLTWSPDSSRLYFSARKGLLAYQVADQRLIVIAATGE